MGTLFVIGIAVFLLYMLQLFLSKRFWDRNLSVEVRFASDHAFCGQESALIETVSNRKWLPIPALHIKFQIHRNLRFQSMQNAAVSDQMYKNDIFSLSFFQKITRTIPFRCEKRGYYRITQADTIASNLFFTGNLIHLFPQNSELYVYPEAVPADLLEIPFRRMMGTLATKRFLYQDPFAFQGIRDYTMQDPLKNVNWKASARSGSLKTNTYEYTAGQEICIVLNLEDESVWHQEVLLEKSISLAASLAARFLTAGISLSLYTNGRDLETKALIQAKNVTGVAQVEPINRQLSRIALEEKPGSFTDLVHKLLSEKEEHRNSCMLVISYSRHEESSDGIRRLAAAYPGLYWIMPFYPDEDTAPKESENISILKWEVKKSYV